MTVRPLVAAWCVVGALAAPSSAAGQESVCPDGNLLAGARPSTFDRASRTSAATDGRAPAEGAYWDTAHTALLQNESSYLEYDLGRSVPITAALLQGDNNDTYELHVSDDRQTWRLLWSVPMADGQGMRTRLAKDLGDQARYVRVGYGRGDGFYSVGEVQLFCAVPARWPPVLQVLREPPKKLTLTREHELSIKKLVLGATAGLALWALLWPWDPRRRRPPALWTGVGAAVATFAGVLTLTYGANGFGAALVLAVAGGIWLRRRMAQKLEWKVWAERASLVALIVAAGHTWINFGTFHGSRVVHLWDTMHYYVGSKYFLENGYDLMYQCAAVAEVDDGRKDEVLERKYRILRDNRLVPASEALADEPLCRERFGEERWAAFQQDLRLFRDLMSPGWFKDSFKDHGYNASPPWTLVGSLISNFGWRDHLPPPALVNAPRNLEGKSQDQKAEILKRFRADRDRLAAKVLGLAFIDFSLYAGIFLLIGWAFGLRAMALAAVVWAVGHPWAYYWTGGGFGRVPWLFCATAGLCVMKKGYPFLSGALITWSGMLRVFPAALAGGVGLRILQNARARIFHRDHVRMALGAVTALVIGVGASLPVVGGIQAYPDFLENSLKHKATPLTNHMGLPTLMSYHPMHVARVTRDNRADDPFARWKELRQSDLADRTVLYWGVVLGLFVLVGYVGRELEDWQVTSLSVTFTFALFELTCYYFNFMILLAPLCVQRRNHTLALVGMAALTQASALVVGWFDELYILESFLVFAVILYVLFDLWRERRAALMEEATAAVGSVKAA